MSESHRPSKLQGSESEGGEGASTSAATEADEFTIPVALAEDLREAHAARSATSRYFWWILPILAFVVAGILMYQAVLQRGVSITIAFSEGKGLSVGSPVNYRGVEVGTVRDMHLDRHHANALVQVELRQDAAELAVAGTRFWVVRPSVSLSGISGLDTLIGPNYIALDPGPDDGARQLFFTGLDTPPEIINASPDGLDILVRASRRGSLKVGSPVYYRDIPVGQIIDYGLSDDSTHVVFRVEIDHQYASIVHEKSRFWNASGLGIDFGWFKGLSFRTDSLESVVSGGIALATPPLDEAGASAVSGTAFDLADQADNDWLEWKPVIRRAGEAKQPAHQSREQK